jgi:two-component system LytT family response regulator
MTAPLFRVLVADAEQASRERLRQLLAPEREFLLVGEAADGPGAVTLTRAHRPHVLLLDVGLPGLSGFEVLEQLRGELAPAVIFVTAMAEHAARAFEAKAVDYLLKPFSADRFRLALGRARDLFTKTLPPGAEPRARSPLPDLIALRTGRGRMVMAVAEIQYATADNTCCNVFTAQGKVAANESLGALEERLPPERFVRISRSALVNITHVLSLGPKSHGDQHLILRSGAQLTVSRLRRQELLKRLGR